MNNNLDEWTNPPKHPATLEKTCPQCGTTFKAVVPWAVYCSDACKQAAYRDRKGRGNPGTDKQPPQSGDG